MILSAIWMWSLWLLRFDKALLAHPFRIYTPHQMAARKSPILTRIALVAVDAQPLGIMLSICVGTLCDL